MKYVGVNFDGLVDSSAGLNECWPWKGAIDPAGYGRWRSGGNHNDRAHREVWRRSFGEPPAKATGLVVDHTCHDPETCKLDSKCPHRSCCNPAHLRVVPQSVNCSRDRSNWRGSAQFEQPGLW